MTKSDFIDWKRSPVTQEVFSQLHARTKEIKDQIVDEAQSGDPKRIAYLAGLVQGFQFLMNIDFEDTNGD